MERKLTTSIDGHFPFIFNHPTPLDDVDNTAQKKARGSKKKCELKQKNQTSACVIKPYQASLNKQ